MRQCRECYMKDEHKQKVTVLCRSVFSFDIYDHPTYRRLSRSPVWTRLQAEEYDIVDESMTNQWQHSDVSNAYVIDDPSVPLAGLKNPALPRNEWGLLNQLISGHCRTTHTLHKWGKRTTLTCNHCGQQPQTIEHLLQKCPVTQFVGSAVRIVVFHFESNRIE